MQDNENTIFTPFQLPPAPPNATEPAEPKKRGGKKGGKKAASKKGSVRKARPVSISTGVSTGGTDQAVAAPIARKPRKARAITVELGTALEALAGLTEDDGRFLTGVVHAMQPFPAAQRRRIVAALSKMFA